ncbi:hypothetical protein ACGFSI_19940 [Streptomyces virginiae]|uniref:hypothetical protein n=1 Tax=Streptomyces virginiae TaxID=1961 RepID=UPI003718EA47
MRIDEAFDDFQRSVNEDVSQTRLARDRRDLFKRVLISEPDVTEAFGSGSLRRSTQLRPINDVDIVAVYDAAQHPDWGSAGLSAEHALNHNRSQVNRLLGKTNGSYGNEVRLALPRNHAVKCFLDDPDDENAFTVDVMPALRQADDTLLIPEKLTQTWVPADPEHLINLVADRQRDWEHFRPLVRVLKPSPALMPGTPAGCGIRARRCEALHPVAWRRRDAGEPESLTCGVRGSGPRWVNCERGTGGCPGRS